LGCAKLAVCTCADVLVLFNSAFDIVSSRINNMKFDDIFAKDTVEPPEESGLPQEKSMPVPALKLTDENFLQTIERYPLVIVDFWTPSSAQSIAVGSIMHEVVREMADKAIFGHLNVDENIESASILGIKTVPAVLVFKDGVPVDGFSGTITKAQMRYIISKHAGSNDHSKFSMYS